MSRKQGCLIKALNIASKTWARYTLGLVRSAEKGAFVFHSIDEIITEIRAGKMVILMDDEDRENEGDLICAASLTTPEHINFMVTHARGLVCMPMTGARARQLGLPLMVQQEDENRRFHTNFTVSIEASEGVTTGISAHDRALTIQKAASRDAKPNDLVQPGHIFPIIAKPGGVLTRAGHTEASCDLVRLAGLEPCAVIVEILKEDGTMARREDLLAFATKWDLKISTIAELIRYRILHERTLECVHIEHVETEHGSFELLTYLDGIDQACHYVLKRGSIDPNRAIPVRVHYQDLLGDVLLLTCAKKSWSLSESMAYVNQQGEGVIVILSHPETFSEIHERLRRLLHQAPEYSTELKTIGAGARILHDLGVKKMKVLSHPKRLSALSGFGLEIVDYILPSTEEMLCPR